MIDWISLIVSLQTALASTLVAAAFAIPAACLGGRRTGLLTKAPGALLIFPAAVSPAVLAIVPATVFGGGSPLVAILFSRPASLLVGFAVAYQASRHAYERIDDNLLDSMRVIGFSGIRLFRTGILPAAWPGILAGVALGFVRALGELIAALMLAVTFERSVPGTAAAAFVFSSLFVALAILSVVRGRRLPA